MIERRFTIRVEAAHRTGIPDWNEENHRLISPKPGFSNPTPEQTTVEVFGRGTATFEAIDCSLWIWGRLDGELS